MAFKIESLDSSYGYYNTYDSCGVVKYGDNGECVNRIQQILRDQGFYKGKITGHFDDNTLIAVKYFQRAYGKQTTGIVDSDTWIVLSVGQTVKSLAPPTTGMIKRLNKRDITPYGIIGLGSNGLSLCEELTFRIGSRDSRSGNCVSQIQTILKNRGFYHGAIDGIFGIQTSSAVKDFQHIAGIVVDGIVGPKTWSMLISAAKGLARKPAQPTKIPLLKGQKNYLPYILVGGGIMLIGAYLIWGK